MIDMYVDETNMKAAALNEEGYESKYFSPKVDEVQSMKEVEGFV